MKDYSEIWAIVSAVTVVGVIITVILKDDPQDFPQKATENIKDAQSPPAASSDPKDGGKPKEAGKRVVPVILGGYSTILKRLDEDGNILNRFKNVELAMGRFEKKLLEAHETMSFNEVVGPRTEENGFLKAPSIFMGELQPGVGGGVCQVSSTLYAALRDAAIIIDKRYGHSRPSGYIGLGLDATVNFPKACNGSQEETAWNGKNKECTALDLVFSSPTNFAIEIAPFIEYPLHDHPNKARIEFQIYGELSSSDEVWIKTKHRWRTNGKTPWEKRFRRTNKFKNDWRKKVQDGKEGVSGISTFTQTLPTGKILKVRVGTEYRPVSEIWEVGLGYDVDGPPPWDIK